MRVLSNAGFALAPEATRFNVWSILSKALFFFVPETCFLSFKVKRRDKQSAGEMQRLRTHTLKGDNSPETRKRLNGFNQKQILDLIYLRCQYISYVVSGHNCSYTTLVWVDAAKIAWRERGAPLRVESLPGAPRLVTVAKLWLVSGGSRAEHGEGSIARIPCFVSFFCLLLSSFDFLPAGRGER